MLENKDGLKAIHNRAKGVSLDTIDKYANDNLNGDKYEVYNKLFNEEKLTFDLLTTKPRMKDTKDRRKINVKEFKRKVKFEGKINVYDGSQKI